MRRGLAWQCVALSAAAELLAFSNASAMQICLLADYKLATRRQARKISAFTLAEDC